MAVTSEMAERDERVGGYLQKDKITPEILKLFEEHRFRTTTPRRRTATNRCTTRKAMRFPRAPWSRTDKDQVEPLSRMEGVPIFVRIIIDIPSRKATIISTRRAGRPKAL